MLGGNIYSWDLVIPRKEGKRGLDAGRSVWVRMKGDGDWACGVWRRQGGAMRRRRRWRGW